MPQDLAEEFRSIPMSSNLGQSLERAHRFARDQSHRLVTLEHLLLALVEDAEAALILQAANVDLARLGTDVSGYLGRLLEDMRAEEGAEPRPDTELLRVLQAAMSAALQSKRRQIDGAIVLAAVVGDGKSPAAGLLKAHGMTFEEAIRALQRANTKARLKPAPKVVTPGTTPPRPATDTLPPPVAAAPEPAVAPPRPSAADAGPNLASPGEALPPAAPQPAGAAADDFLAAARARIQQRAGPAAPAPSHAPPPPAPSADAPALDDPPIAPVDAVETEALTHAIEAAMAAPTVRRSEPPAAFVPPPPLAAEEELAVPEPVAPPSPPARAAPQPSWTPPAEPRPRPTPRQGLPQRAPQPMPSLKPPPPDGVPRPSMPPPHSSPAFAVPHPQPPPHTNGSGPRVPWPESAERPAHPHAHAPHAPGSHAPLRNGDLGLPPYATMHPPGSAPRTPQPGPRAAPALVPRSGHPERGPLVENIPRRMRSGVAASGEVRIARDRIEGLLAALSGGAPPRPGMPAARALTVRLRAPGGGFLVEAASPETQWVESASSLIHEDDAVWRWTILPQQRGRSRLLLMVSARSIGPDGTAIESAPPDRIIEVRVRGAGYGRRLGRWLGLLLALLAGVLAGRFGEALVPALVATFRQMAGV